MKVKTISLIFLSLLCFQSITAQERGRKMTIRGSVYDVYRGPVENAIIMIDGQKTNSLTDSKGKFKVKVKRNATAIGFISFDNGLIEEPINGRTVISVNYKNMSVLDQGSFNQSGDEAVNVGYGYLKKKNVTNSISRISGRNKDYSTYSSVFDMIQREVPGVRISGNSVYIRESSNLEGPIEALYVVDGTYVDSIENVRPSAVESIEVLKDGSATIFGTRAFGGVILIKTKLQN
jgi:TonB-dependent SusC/RagA subfamily outer membrane receptor